MDNSTLKTDHYDEEVPVLIVGGGLVGLSQALFLQKQGVPFVLLERHQGTSILPRARGIHFRTMEFYREVGVEKQIQEVGATVIKQGRFGGVRVGRTMLSAEALQFSAPHGFLKDELSPSSFCFCPQDELEPILLAAARERGGDLRFSTELAAFEQDEHGVTATLVERTGGRKSRVHAAYLLAADGARSPIRTALGITTGGQGVLEHYLNIYFEADLSEQVRGRTFSQCLVENEQVRGLFIALNNTNRWAFHLLYDPLRGEKAEDFPLERCAALVRKAIGVSDDLALKIKVISPWDSAMRIANSYQQGRVLLVGDAAHLMPPWGALGGTTGIADAHNLAWKLAAIFKAQATPDLLATYQQERRPVAWAAGKQAALGTDIYTRYAIPTATNAEDLKQLIDPLLLVLSYHYHSDAIVEPPTGYVQAEEGTLRGLPGTRIPHMWLSRGDEVLSTLDLAGTRFVLLTGEEGEAWCEAARTIAAQMTPPGVELAAYRVGPAGDLQDERQSWQEMTGCRPGDALLLRPDSIVAWRSTAGEAPAPGRLQEVLKQVLGWSQYKI